MRELSIVVPTYNEFLNIEPFINHLEKILTNFNYEIVFIDDNSPDGTSELVRSIARVNPRVRLISRVGRRGLSGACIEGFCSAIYDVIVVTDADMQHDLNSIPSLFQKIDEGFDLVLGTRYANEAQKSDFREFNLMRGRMSEFATLIARKICRVNVSDPVSGFFAVKRNSIKQNLQIYNSDGFKILLDILINDRSLRVAEVSYKFKPRQFGESKLDSRAVIDFITLILSSTFFKKASPRLILFFMVGAFGLMMHLVIVKMMLTLNTNFFFAQLFSTTCIILLNFYLNNVLTYSDKRLRGFAFFYGLLKFYLISSMGLLANLGFSNYLFDDGNIWFISALCGALIGATWNYFLSMYLVWSKR